ncbi:ribonuclease Z [Chondrinema litorale]|uniref:ribonuclease Z n=1 Tax=Chondrinema litorale TaxID=2994555 RepID=UPI0025441695|nr:ribonuclease Z [Chondrinema litorale]UZR93699.1 ribonuclease Z [Chondrinema litorale]
MSISVQILGASSATPAWNRFMTSQLLEINQQYCLIDCGEGTQYQLLNLKAKTSKIDYIFISHMHGDHIFGLPGLLSSMSLLGRTKELYLFAPAELREVLISINRASQSSYNFPIQFIETQDAFASQIFENEYFSVTSVPLEHRVPCCGFIFREKKKKNKLLAEKLPKGFPFELMKELKDGKSVFWEEKEYLFDEYTVEPPPPLSYAFCSDTAYSEKILEHIDGVDILYHEATFVESDSERAVRTKHSTASQAATIASKANVKKLVIGHFSIRYKELNQLLEEAQRVFPETFLALEGKIFTV